MSTQPVLAQMNGRHSWGSLSSAGLIWMPMLAGFTVLCVSLAHIPPACSALNYFDPVKRLVWAVAAAIIGICVLARSGGRPDAISSSCMLLGLWMVFRSLLRSRPGSEVEVLAAWLMPLVLFALGRKLRVAGSERALALILLGAGVIQALLMLLQRLGHDPLFPDTTRAMLYSPGRMIGTIGYHNQAVDFLALCSSALFLCMGSMPWRLSGFAVLLAVAALTGNRGGIAGIIAGVFLSEMVHLLAKRPQGILRRAAGLSLGVLFVSAALLLLIPQSGNRFLALAMNVRHDPAMVSRQLMARIAIEMWRQRPLTGWGAGEYALQYVDRLGSLLPAEKTHTILRSVVFAREAHNDYLQFVAEFGLIGGILFASVALAVLVALWKSRQISPERAAGTVLVLTYMSVGSMISFPWQTSAGGPLAGLILGFLVPEGVLPARGDEPCPIRRWQVWPEKVCLAGSILFLLCWSAADAYWNIAVPRALDSAVRPCERPLLPPLASRYRALVGADLARQGKTEEAAEMLTEAGQGYRDIVLLNNLGNVLAQKARWTEALAVYERWAASGIGHEDALRNLSVAHEQLGQPAEAAKWLSVRLGLWPTRAPAEIRRLVVLDLAAKDAVSAMQTIARFERRCLYHGYEMPAEFENLAGAASLMLGYPAEAKERFRRALGKNPELISARRNLELPEGPPTNVAGAEAITGDWLRRR